MRHDRRTAPNPIAAAAFAACVLAACADDGATPTETVEETPPRAEALGLIEITITGLGGHAEPSASAVSAADVTDLERQRAARASAGTAADGSGATPQAFTAPEDGTGGGDGTIQIEPLSTGTFTDGDRDADGERYFWATYRVRNAQDDGTAYDTPRENLTFLAVTDGTTLGGHTPITALEVYGGDPAAGAIADDIVPTGAAARDQGTGEITSHHPDVLQVVTETEAGGITPPSGVTDVFPYGFTVRRADRGDSRTLPASPAADEFDGLVTFAFRMPLQATSADDPFTVRALFAAYDDGEARTTQSVEEQAGVPAARFAERAEALGATSVALLPDGTDGYTTADAFLRCDVRATGTEGSATAYVHQATSTDPWLVTDPSAVAADGPAFLPSTGRIRVARCGDIWSTPDATNFIVHGSQSGPVSGGYAGTGGDEGMIQSPTGDFVAGEIVEATLTTGLGIADPIVARYRVDTDGPAPAAFDSVQSFGQGSFYSTYGDFDGDGHLDIATVDISNENLEIRLAGSDGTVDPADTYDTGTLAKDLAFGDLDGDGDLDALVLDASLSGTPAVILHSNDGDGTFSSLPNVDLVGSDPYNMAVGDLNGDGDPDVAVVHGSDDIVEILLGDGAGSLSPHASVAAPTSPRQIAVGDMDGDGALDIVVAHTNAPSGVAVLPGNGDGTFSAPETRDLGAPSDLEVGDVDGDGRLDVVTVRQLTSTLSVLSGNGDGTLAAPVDHDTGDPVGELELGDVDGDGDLDAVALGGLIDIMRGTGDGTFAAPRSFETAGSNTPVLGDLDGDGDLDLVVGGDPAVVLHNR